MLGVGSYITLDAFRSYLRKEECDLRRSLIRIVSVLQCCLYVNSELYLANEGQVDGGPDSGLTFIGSALELLCLSKIIKCGGCLNQSISCTGNLGPINNLSNALLKILYDILFFIRVFTEKILKATLNAAIIKGSEHVKNCTARSGVRSIGRGHLGPRKTKIHKVRAIVPMSDNTVDGEFEKVMDITSSCSSGSIDQLSSTAGERALTADVLSNPDVRIVEVEKDEGTLSLDELHLGNMVSNPFVIY